MSRAPSRVRAPRTPRGPSLTPMERKAIRIALGFLLAGEPPEGMTDAQLAAARSAQAKLDPTSR